MNAYEEEKLLFRPNLEIPLSERLKFRTKQRNLPTHSLRLGLHLGYGNVRILRNFPFHFGIAVGL